MTPVLREIERRLSRKDIPALDRRLLLELWAIESRKAGRQERRDA